MYRFERQTAVYEGQDNGNGATGRNAYLYKLACSLNAKGVPEGEAQRLVAEENRAVCRPPIPDREAEKCCGSAYTHPSGYSPEIAAKYGPPSGRPALPALAAPGRPAAAEEKAPEVPNLLEKVDLEGVRIPEAPDLTAPEQVRAQFAAMFRDGESGNVVFESLHAAPIGAGEMIPAAALADEEAAETLLSLAGDAGAWLRVNPTSGEHAAHGRKGEGDADVCAFRHTLIECDPEGAAGLSEEGLEEARLDQLRRVVALRLPCACIVSSAHKSVHCCVRIADPGEELDRREWERRRDLVYRVCDASGLQPDPQCKNPSRLMRLAGAKRGGREQTLLAVDCGARTFGEWAEWVRRASRGPSVFRTAAEMTGPNVRPMPPDVVDGVLAEQEVALLVGQSGSGKSWLALQLGYAVATGRPWLGIPTHARPVVYVNAEITEAAFSNRMEQVRRQMGAPLDVDMLVLNAEVAQGLTAGQVVDLIHEEGVRGALVVVDCLYLYVETNENDNAEMARLMKTFKRLCLEDGDTLVLIHHTGKGAAGSRAVVDRGAGAGVLGRFCNDRLSLIGLDVPEGSEAEAQLAAADAQAFRLEMVLRDHPRYEPIDLLYTGTRFVPDPAGLLASCRVQGSPQSNGARAGKVHTQTAEERWDAKAELARSILGDLAASGVHPTAEAFLHQWHAGAAAHGLDSGLGEATLRKWLRPSFASFPFTLSSGEIRPASG